MCTFASLPTVGQGSKNQITMKKEANKSKEVMSKELMDKYIRFDWAIKRLLRQKANFGVLEGLLTVLLNEKVTIVEILESEGNQEFAEDKYNRVDIKAKNSKDEIIIVEIQNTREVYYLERILYGVAKAITEHISLGSTYQEVKKIYSISILYFDLGKGRDYLYHGMTHFVGVHTGDRLKITAKEKEVIVTKSPAEIYPEYFLIRVNEFDKVAATPLEEWVNYLKNGVIAADTKTPGLAEAREKLRYYNMTKAERDAYDEHLSALMIQNDLLGTTRMEGVEEGLAKGLAKGRVEGRAEGERKKQIEIARNLKKSGVSSDIISLSTGLSVEEISAL